MKFWCAWGTFRLKSSQLPSCNWNRQKTYIIGVGSLIKSDFLQQLLLNMIVYSQKLSLRLSSEEALSQCNIENSRQFSEAENWWELGLIAQLLKYWFKVTILREFVLDILLRKKTILENSYGYNVAAKIYIQCRYKNGMSFIVHFWNLMIPLVSIKSNPIRDLIESSFNLIKSSGGKLFPYVLTL